MVDRVTLWILLGVIGVTTIGVIALRSVYPMITAEVALECEQINFSPIRSQEDHQPIALLNSGLWLAETKISQFDQILFKTAPSTGAMDLARLSDGGEVTISPASPDGYVRLRSSEEVFSLRDIFIEPPSRVSWSVHDAGQRILIMVPGSQNRSEISASFSTGDSLYLSVYNCAFLDQAGGTLHRTQQGVVEDFVFPVSFARQRANVVTKSGRFDVDIRIQSGWFAENMEIVRALEVENVDCSAKEYSATGELRERNTVLAGVIKRPAYGLEDSVGIRQGDFITATPAAGRLESLRADSSALRAAIKADVRSLKIGPNPGAQHEMVKSMLATLWENQTLIIGYTVVMALFTLITRFIVKRKKEGN